MLRTGEVVKRFGTTALATALIGGGVIPAAAGCGQHRGALCSLSVPGPSALCTWSPTEQKWAVAQGDRRGLINVARTPVRGSVQGPANIAYGAGFYFVVSLDTVGPNIVLDVLDAANGHVVLTAKIATAVVNDVRVSFCNGYGILYYRVGNDAKFLTVNATTFAQATTTIANGALLLPGVRQLNSTTVQFIGSASVAGHAVSGIDFVPSTGATTQWTLNDSGGLGITGTTGIPTSWLQDFGASGKIAAALIDQTSGALMVHWDIPSTGATRQAVSSYTLDAAPAAPFAVTGHTTGSSATGEFIVLYGLTGSGGATRSIAMASRLSGAITTGPVLYRSMSLSSDTWTYNGDYYVLGTLSSSTQGTRYVLRVPTTTTAPTVTAPLAQFAVRGGVLTVGAAQVANPSAGKFVIAYDYQQKTSTGAFNPDAYAVAIETITHLGAQQTTLCAPREAIGSLFVPGGNLGQFDGVTFAEAGFAYRPQAATLTPNVAGSNTRYYKLVYLYTDAQGKAWRSEPSLSANTGTSSPIGSGGSVTVACPTLRIAGRSNVTIEVYGSTDNVLYQKLGSVANSLTVDSVNFSDANTDATLAGGEFLYTTGGELAAQTPPGFIAIASWDNRLWGVSMDDPQSLWFTNEFTLQGGLIWNEANVIDVKDQHGDIRALGVVDGNLVVLKDDATYVVQGQGPNGAGQGGSYAAQIVANGVGCSNAQALLETKDGLIFRANVAKPTFYMLDRGLSLQPLGGAQRYASETIVGAAFVATLQQSQFYTASGRTLVYDLVSQMWSTHTGQPANTATVWNGNPVYYNPSDGFFGVGDLTGATYVELANFVGRTYSQTVTWPWLSLNSIKGYERFYRVQVLGEMGVSANANATATMSLYKDFNDGSPLTSASLANATTTDAELRYSAKLSSMKVKLAIADDLAPSAGWKLSGLSLVYGAKAGLAKRPATSRFT